MAVNDPLPAALNEDPHREPTEIGPFAILWHIGTLGLLAIFLGVSLYNAANEGSLGWQSLALVVMTIAQAGIYVQTMVRTPSWPPPAVWLFLHFGVAPALILLEQAISTLYISLWWVYFSFNLSGVLPPRLAIAHMTLMVVMFIGSVSDWQWANLSTSVVIISLMSLLASAPFYLLVRKLFEFSDNRNKLVAELQTAYRDLAKAKARESELAVLHERERLARDMHDNLGHALVAISVQLEAAQRLYKKDPERASQQMDAMKQLARESTDALRRTLAGLRTPGLGERPLRIALQESCAALSQRSGLSVTCNIAPQADTINRAVAEALWSVAQEALANIEKHARARHAEVRVEMYAAGVTLNISDDGVGLREEDAARPGHYGLRGMRERIAGLGGTLNLHPRPAGGTLIEASIPLVGGQHT